MGATVCSLDIEHEKYLLRTKDTDDEDWVAAAELLEVLDDVVVETLFALCDVDDEDEVTFCMDVVELLQLICGNLLSVFCSLFATELLLLPLLPVVEIKAFCTESLRVCIKLCGLLVVVLLVEFSFFKEWVVAAVMVDEIISLEEVTAILFWLPILLDTILSVFEFWW